MSKPPPPQPSLDYSVVEFEPIEEKWNEYEFSDGTRIKFRVILVRLTHERGAPPNQYNVSANNLVTVFAPPSERGAPTPPMSPDEIQDAEKFEARPITSTEPWNSYRLVASDNIIKIKYVASNFFRLKDKYDQFGEPFYTVLGGPLIVPQPKGSKRKRTP